MKPLPALTSCRFFAALWVVLYHFSPREGLPPLVARLLDRGYVGVSFFFVLSGFILGYNYTGRMDVRRFFMARLARIAPVYFLSLLVMVPIMLRNGGLHSLLVGSVALTGFQSWSPSLAMCGNGPAWSVSTEFTFYLGFPWLLGCVSTAERKEVIHWLLGSLFASFLFAAGYSFFVDAGLSELKPDQQLYLFSQAMITSPIIRLPEFVAGVALSQLYMRGDGVKHASWYTVVSVVMLTIGLVLPTPIALARSGLLVAPMCALVWSLANSDNPFSKALAVGPLEFLGKVSYAIYLLQIPAVVYVGAIWKRIAGTEPPVILWLPVLIALSAWVHLTFEEPLRRRLTTTSQPAKALAV